MPPRLDRDARKAQLAEAVWQVVLDHGISAVSVRTVAEQAGVVVGSLRHVFPTRAELMAFSAELMVQRASERVVGTAWNDHPEAYVLAVIEQLLPLSADARAEFEVNMALMAEAAALPELLVVRDEAHRKLADLSLRMVELLTGRSDDESTLRPVARRLHALIDGLAFHLLHHAPDADASWALDIVRMEISGIRAGSGVDG